MQQFQSLLCNFYLFVKYLLGGVKRRLTQTIVVTILKNAKANFYEKSIIFYGMPVLNIQKGANIFIGQHFICTSGIQYPIDNRICSKINVMKDGTLSIGDDVGMSNTCIHCHKSITIEKGTKIGAGCLIVDTDFHSLHWEDRADHTDIEKRQCKPVHIGAYAFIGTNSIILKGVNIGEKAIIGAGSVVSRDIPSGEIWGGNPAKFIKKIP